MTARKLEIKQIQKRDGRYVNFDIEKIAAAIEKAFAATGEDEHFHNTRELSEQVYDILMRQGETSPEIEHIQDTVEQVLIENGFTRTSKAYILYRAKRNQSREMKTRLMRVYEDLTFKDSQDSNLKRENANIDCDTAMGTMLRYGSEGAKQFNEMFVLAPKHTEAHKNGDIHIHDLDFLTLTTTCCQIDLLKLFKNGFSTGHGTLREPNHISSYAALACIAIQANQNDQHGGQSVGSFDYGLAPGVAKTYVHLYRDNIKRALALLRGLDHIEINWPKDVKPNLSDDNNYTEVERELLKEFLPEGEIQRIQDFAREHAERETDRATYKAMVALVHNLNTMHSRAGAQTPFSSINYGCDTSPEGRLVIKNVLLATKAGLGNGETSIFPIQIFRVKSGISYNPGDPNYDLFKLACEVSAKRLFPNFSFIDAPYNLQYYKPGQPETEVAYMGCRTRVIANVYDKEKQTINGRGNLSFTSINLPKLGINAEKDIKRFYEMLDEKIELTAGQLLERFNIQARKRVRNFPFLMGEGIWMDSENLEWDDEVGEVLKHGTLSIGFIGLAETLTALIGKHHGESKEAQKLGLEIVGHMRKRCDELSEKHGLNFTLLATPAEGLSGRFISLDQKHFGILPGITDKEYYTNSFHVPVDFNITAYDKIKLEAPYHAFTNAGHITYVELDGDPVYNIDAFESLVRAMHDAGVGYGAINHPLDRDPVCGYSGVIEDRCPGCGRFEYEDIPFDRIRRITGYLGTLDRFNDAKRAEERDRIKHS